MFEYINTNFRTQNSFITQFVKFKEREGKSRGEWPKQDHHGQELDKHRVINMVQSKLFKKDVDGLSYSRTMKGAIYDGFIKAKMSEEEKWLINYLFLINGYYLNRKNYIVHRVKEDLLNCLLSVNGVTKDLLIEAAKKLLIADSFGVMLRSDFFYLHSFYNDPDFLISYFRASDADKSQLAEYIEKNLKTKKFVCCISAKYQPSGNFNRSMLLDETRVFLLTLLFVQSNATNLSNVYDLFVDNFKNNISPINNGLVMGYLRDRRDIFDSIFIDILDIEEGEMIISEDITADAIKITEIDKRDKKEDYIDETSEIGRLKIKSIYRIRKRQARILSDYTCALEKINNCRSIYFTAKISGKNYLELHHFIPREFRNDFSYSIEILANYITLCPRCHRQMHLAIDRERKHLINALYDERKERLTMVGLELDLAKIYEYYRIDF